MNKKSKFLTTVFIATVSYNIFHYLSVRKYYGPWFYGYVTGPEEFIGLERMTSVESYVISMSDKSIIYRSLIETYEIVLGTNYTWVLLPVGAFVISIYAYSYFTDIQYKYRLLFVFATVAGPFGVILYTYSIGRDAVDLVLIFTFLSIVKISYKYNQRLFALSSIVFSFIFWLLHYSFWPFFILTVMCIGILDVRDHYSSFVAAVVATVSPLAIYAPPVFVFISSINSIKFRSLFAEESLQSKVRTLEATSIDGLSDSTVSVLQTTNSEPPWMPEIQYILLFLLCVLLVTIWGYSALKVDKHYGVERKLLFSLGIAFVGTTILYTVRGYLFRSVVFWPLVFPIFLNDLAEMTISNVNMEKQEKLVISIVFLICLVQVIPVLIPGFYTEKRPEIASNSQVMSSQFIENIERSSIVYTDLTHANAIVVETNHRYVHVGWGENLKNGSILVSKGVTVLNKPKGEGYILISESYNKGTTIWGGNIQTITPSVEHNKRKKIYTNGPDSVYKL